MQSHALLFATQIQRPQKELDKKYLLSMEKEVLGIYVSGHPLDDYIEDIMKYSNFKSSDFLFENKDEDEVRIGIKDGMQVRAIGIITNVKTKITKNNDINKNIKNHKNNDSNRGNKIFLP